MALPVPLLQFTSRVGGGSKFYIMRHATHIMSNRPTKQELEREAALLRKRVWFLECKRNAANIILTKVVTAWTVALVTFVTAIGAQALASWYGKPSPFSATFVRVLLGIGLFALCGFLVSLALILKRPFKFKAELAEKTAKLEAIVQETKTKDDAT